MNTQETIDSMEPSASDAESVAMDAEPPSAVNGAEEPAASNDAEGHAAIQGVEESAASTGATDTATGIEEPANNAEEHAAIEGAEEPAATNSTEETAAMEDDFPVAEDGRVVIDVTRPLDRIVDRCVRLLAEDPFVFQKHGELVRVVTEEGNRVRLRPLRSIAARYLLSQKAHWVREDKPVHPPECVAKCIVSRTAWERIRVLRAVTSFPAMNADGGLPTEPGYDERTETYFTGELAVQVPERPSQDDARNAVAVLHDIVGDFPFANDEHRAAWLAGLLTPLARYAHDGNAPLILVQANGPRIGKTTLVKLISHIVFGADTPVITFTKNEDETRKRILSILREGESMVLIDNVGGQFGGQNVNALVTSRTFKDRVLGRSVTLEAINDTSWFVTGNNIQLGCDTAERCVNVRLQWDGEKPQERTGFKYPFLFETVRERRAELLSAALTILRAFIIAGKPVPSGMPAWGGFEAWSRLVRGALIFAGVPDPAATRFELEEHADIETDDKSALVAGIEDWQTTNGIRVAMRVNEILEHLRAEPKASSKLRRALEDVVGSPGALPDTKTFARHLRDAWNRNFGGLILRKEPDKKNGHRWRVERVGEPLRVVEAEGVQAA